MRKTWPLLLMMMLVGVTGFEAVWGQETEWTRQFGTSGYDQAFGVSVGASGVYVVGRTNDTLPGQESAGGVTDALVRKYEVDGDVVWTRQFGTGVFDGVYGVSVNASGVYVAGFTRGALPGQFSAGFFDAFVARFLIAPVPVAVGAEPSAFSYIVVIVAVASLLSVLFVARFFMRKKSHKQN